MIYEERRITLKRGQLDAFTEHFTRNVKPALTESEGEVLCTLSAVIGDPTEELLQVTRYPDIERWERAQSAYDESRMALSDSEDVRLLRSVSSRPKHVVTPDDMRAFYGHRRFFISPTDLDEFVEHSQNGIWPRIEAQGASILGLWTPIAATAPQEIILLTGYHGPAHWEETRQKPTLPKGVEQGVWTLGTKARTGRSDITIRTWVRLMRRLEV
ncbi:MAG: hypothetical protein QGG34_08415 [SAR202 cluster bacterium]|jgi:hypothetical protein|nr:hypothetical protein [SAR202 cluster bacterium]MDP6273090.1 hypothetical protein [Dehalococcoidia bacterium]MDP7104953.1 hypothetical protein [SAR202 cluster bacterium]MDP7225253.1 hypothetical protein [SAR202 cluster bacterium]MDP7414661.1 hypothetical protein [SAR202 cluster bacterium]|tara:strand:+ start:18168 stop:18809 length:642 start_codon:yes stop_codon:yes gene_type:complete